MPITTHIIDTAEGRPAEGIRVAVEFSLGLDEWEVVGMGVTNADGRVPGLVPPEKRLQVGVYRMNFNVGPYFVGKTKQAFFPYVQVIFEIDRPSQLYHVPLLISPYGYSTYRG